MERTRQIMNPRRGQWTDLEWLHRALLTAAAMTALTTAIGAQQAAPRPAATSTPAAKTQATKTPHQESDGERVFAENCSRCHNPPDGFSPHISGTIVRHMRMRASLSEQDEKALLRF